MEIDWTLRPVKEQSRVVVAKQSATRKNHLLAMPSDCGLDVRHLIEKGVSHPQSSWTIIDGCPKKIDSFRKLQILDGYKVRYHSSKFAKIKRLDPVDFAWFDLCGNLTKDDMMWFREEFRFMASADIWFTLALGGTRGNSFFHRLSGEIPKLFSPLIKGLIDTYHPEFAANKKADYTLPVVIRWKLLEFLFPTAGKIKCYFYNDTQPMGLFHLSEFGVDRPETDIDGFIGSFLDETCLVHQIVGVRSSKKAQEHQHRINLLASYSQNPEKYKAKIKKLVEKENQKLLNIVFE